MLVKGGCGCLRFTGAATKWLAVQAVRNGEQSAHARSVWQVGKHRFYYLELSHRLEPGRLKQPINATTDEERRHAQGLDNFNCSSADAP